MSPQPPGVPLAQPPISAGINTTPCSLPQAGSTPQEALKLSGGPNDAREDSAESADDEINEYNHHTNGIEFHGSTSSAAIIGHLQKAREPKKLEEQRPGPANVSLISALHNPSFSPSTSGPGQLLSIQEHNYYFDQAHVFMNGYFENIHFIHPFIDKEDFLLRANDLWFNQAKTPEPSFVALYLSVLSFGSLVRVWDEDKLAGLGRFEWSRKLFSEAQAYLNHLRFSNDLETVQCLYFMVSGVTQSEYNNSNVQQAKICQNELNPNCRLVLVVALYLVANLASGLHVPRPGRSHLSLGWI